MNFKHGEVYHVYNRGNNKTRIFLHEANYYYLLRKIRREWLAYCDIYCFCLMPNHFHFMLKPNAEGCEFVTVKGMPTHMQMLSRTIGKTLSSYTMAINQQEQKTGNLFQKKTKAKCLTEAEIDQKGKQYCDYLRNCFNYIHENPVAAGLVTQHRDWKFSSWHEYYADYHDGFCKKEEAM